ncbi:MAG: SDR family NAD(P)-dependent oxidoreductase [Thermodesulfovibrionales bacterium]
MALKQRSVIGEEHPVPVIGFVWRPEEITPQVLAMAQRTGSRAVFDLSMMDMEGMRSFLQKTDPDGLVRDIRISVPGLMDPSLGRLLQERGLRNIWIECLPWSVQTDLPGLLQRLRELSEDCRLFPVIGDPDLLRAILKDSPGVGGIALKGCEASGFVSSETTLSLYSLAGAVAGKMPSTSSGPSGIFIWGGVSTPEAAAAFLSTGAAGIVFESLHWLTDMVAIDDVRRQRLSSLRMDSTDLVGLDLQVPCRLFNKGNSLAFREIRTFEDSLCGKESTEESRRSFINLVHARALHPLESHFKRDEVIPLGLEAASAASFVARFGAGTEAAVQAFMDEIRKACCLAATKKDSFIDSPAAAEMGTTYPFIQGAMSWITDVPEFAASIAGAGGLPTIALGLMDAETLDRRLGRLPEVMGGRPYAVNVVTLSENPFREAHLAWIKKQRPRFVVIAGGDLSPIQELTECGITVMYIAPDEALLRLALEAGVRYVICEGYEAGGHVGQHSTLTLAQMVLDLKQRRPSLFQHCRVVLAGGICDRETAFMAAMLGADALQMGTAYLTVPEIVETGALSALYQRMVLKAPPGGTVVSGKATGLRVRSLKTPKVEAILSLEREFAAGHQDEASFRKRMEEMAAGSLLVAARGLDRPGGEALDERACLERGQFMSGACAGLIHEPQRLKAFHRELAEGPLTLYEPLLGPVGKIPEAPASAVSHGLKRTATTREDRGRDYDGARVAITGMSILNALGKTPEEVWAASLQMKSGITLVPPSKWDQALFYDPRPQVPDKSYCRVGAFLDFTISRNELGIPPHDFRTMTEATKITLWLADRAIRASGILDSDIPRERIGVFISQNSGEAAGALNNTIIRAFVHDILGAVQRAVPLTPDQKSAIEREVKSGRMAPDDTTLLGRLNSAAAGFICNKYGFMGPSYAVSAACATSLVALHSALQMVRTGILDAAIVGGGEEDLNHLHFLEFSALGALYGMSGKERSPHETSRPFDAERDGMVLGEGGGMIVIEREGIARARGARLHAVITGMGASNNNLGMVESSHITQKMAISASFRGLPYGPDAVDLVECHATSTRQGDVEEVRALKAVFDPSARTVLTAFKSQIGHTLGASGINSLIRGVMAMKSEIFPATLNYEHPDPELGLTGSGLVIAQEPLDWKCNNGRPRRFQVNAFGFGGSNYVVQVEQARDEADTVLVSPDRGSGFEGDTGKGSTTPQGVSFFRTGIDGSDFRIAALAESDEEARAVIERSASLVEAGTTSSISSPGALRSLAQKGIFIGREGLPALPLAFVFPGQGAQYVGMGRDLYESFPVIREWLDRAAASADFDLLQLLFHDQEENLQKTRWQQPAMFAVEHAMARYLTSLGIRPVAMAGHSLGELTALCMAGVYSPEDGFRIVNKRALCMDKASAMNLEPGVMAAVDVPLDLLNEMLRGVENVYIGNINSPNQVVLSGGTQAVRDLGIKIKKMGYRATLLPVSMAFHSPVMRVIHEELKAFVAAIPFHAPQIPVISNFTMAPYPSDPDEIRRILMAHLESIVHWMHNVRTLWDDYGVRLFVEVGPGDILSGLIADTLPDPTCIRTCLPSAEGETYRTALAHLFVEGHLKVAREPGFVSLPALMKPPASESSALNIQGSPDLAATPLHQEHLEALIQIIMEATGFNRDEIEPDMDLRKDLSIRSSRLPIIMDAAERRFGITIELEDFIGLRTVREIAHKISDIVGPGHGTSLPSAGAQVKPDPAEQQEHLEALIRIIMEATGFNRDEIEPDMDLRKDLSIRSSRLPIIMDAAERRFGITIELEDFIGLRTVREIAQKISGIVAGKEGVNLPPAGGTTVSGQVQDETLKPIQDRVDLKRLVFRSVPLKPFSSAPIQLSPGETVLFLSPDRDDGDTGLAKSIADIFRQDHRVDTLPLSWKKAGDSGQNGYDIFSDEGSAEIAARISGAASLAGMVVTLPAGWSGTLQGMTDISLLLRGLFLALKTFLRSPAGKFVVLMHSREDAEAPGRLLVEGMLGLFLSAAQEDPSIQFRTVEIEQTTDLRNALRNALDRGCTLVETMHRDGKIFTSEGHIAPSVFGVSRGLALGPGDVIVMSGGATGISANLARCLAPFSPRLVFLGRTSTDSDINRASEIARTLADLQASGIEATYHTCDVTDPEAVAEVMQNVARSYGRIDGIIHGAGVLRDGLLREMTPDELSLAADVKFLGAWNLFSSAEKAGLRFFAGLSSAASILGNPGQSNYAAGNRMMSALLSDLDLKNSSIRFKALMLPPVEGAGMAEAPEVREFLKQQGAAYIHVNELAALFCRELFVAPANDNQVLFMRRLPAVKTAMLSDADTSDAARPSPGEKLYGGTVTLNPGDFPMIESISSLDLRRGELEAFRSFSREKDLWITDHRPFRFMKHPLVSACMALETFMEAARVLYPHLRVQGVRRVRLMEMIECPPGVSRPARISCRRTGNGLREVVCEVSLETQEISPTGRLTDRFIPHFRGQVLLAGIAGYPGEGLPDFPVRPDELLTRPMDHKKVLAWYKDHSGFEDRYRVIESLEGAGPGAVRGRTICRETDDFAGLRNAQYQYSPYLFEALLQLAGFQIAETDPSERRSMIPIEIGEMRFMRKCREGEEITLEARLRAQDNKGLTWDARGLDDQGRPLMQIKGIRLHWVSD